jgi:hypothetical protein
MSKHNKANRDHYMQAGRLTPDDMARERQKQRELGSSPARERVVSRADEPPRRAARESSSRRSSREE